MKILVEVSLSDKNGQVCVVREISNSEYLIGTRLSENFKEIMSRSYKKTISFGKSDNGGMTRCKKTYGDFMAEKARKEGKVVYYSLDDNHISQIFDCGLAHIQESCKR